MFGSVVNKSGFENHGYMHGISCISIVESAEKMFKDDNRVLVAEKAMAMDNNNNNNNIDENGSNTYSSSSTSSIGKNSDASGNSIDNSEDTEEEVQSSYKSSLYAMEELEEVLPIRRGISRFYKGKSKSFASLADAAASVKDLAKPENAYARRRRNLLAYNLSWDKNKNFPLKSNNGGISKRVTNSSRTTLALAVAMNNSTSNSNDSFNQDSENFQRSSPLLSRFHPLFKEVHGTGSSSHFSPWRSFSLADLQECNSGRACIGSATLIEAKPS